MADVIYLCRGSGCKKRKGEAKTLRRGLGESHRVEEVGCQKICKGPVAGAKVAGKLRWFRKLDAGADLVELRQAMRGGSLPKRLADKQVEKRAGKLR